MHFLCHSHLLSYTLECCKVHKSINPATYRQNNKQIQGLPHIKAYMRKENVKRITVVQLQGFKSV